MTSLLRRNGFGAWDPWRLLEETEARMRDWVETPVGFTPIHRVFGENRSYVPPMDVYETENEVFVFASLPGIDANTVEVKAQNGTLIVSGDQTPVFPEGHEKSVRAHLTGIPRYGKFNFAVTLPMELDWQSAEARYQEGLLRIRFNKPEQAKPIRIPLNTVQDASVISTIDQPRIEGKQKSPKN
jgi:HSP20 family protein